MHKKIGILLVLVLLFGVVLYTVGKMDVYTEYPGETVTAEFVGYVSAQAYAGQVTLNTADFPEECRRYLPNGQAQQLTITLAAGQNARLGMFVDFVKIDNVHQTRNLLTGNLQKEATTSTYQPRGNVVVLPVDAAMSVEATFDHQLIALPKVP